MIKKDWFFFPASIVFKALGGIPVDRDSPQGTVHQMVQRFAERDEGGIILILQSSRKALAKASQPSKTGFWHIAKEAHVSIICWYLDNENKVTRWLGEVAPGDDKARDIITIQKMYAEAGYRFPLDISSLKKGT